MRIALILSLVLGSFLLASQVRRQSESDLLRILLEQQSDKARYEIARRREAQEMARQFDEKFNDHGRAMNAIADDRNKGVANLKHFVEAEKSWEKLRSDPGWLKKKTR